jgi:tankyrase
MMKMEKFFCCRKFYLKTKNFYFSNVNLSGLEPIHNASSFGHCEVIELLLEHGANVNAADRWQWTPLHESCMRAKLDVALLLVRKGADVNRKNLDGMSAIDLCPDGSDLKLILTGEYRKSELLEAARQGDESTLLTLLTPLNVNINASDGRKVNDYINNFKL